MNKKVLGIAIPYYANTPECEKYFKELMQEIYIQIFDGIVVYVYEDGQISEWLKEYKKDNIIIESCSINKGVSYARNKCLEYLLDKVNYILYIDSDDIIDDDYLKLMYEYCADNSHDVIESGFYVNQTKCAYNPNVLRCGVAGSAIKSNIINDIRFKDNLQIGEDTKFMKDVVNLSKHRKKLAPTNYHYRLGINRDSLTMLYQRNEINKKREV